MFWYTMLMTNLPDIFKLPMDALRLRVIIGASWRFDREAY